MKILPRKQQRIVGALVFLASTAFTAWEWNNALTKGYYHPKASVIFPLFAVFGLAIMVFPNYTDERIARGEDVTGLSGLSLITTRWWIISAVALGAGLANLWLISR